MHPRNVILWMLLVLAATVRPAAVGVCAPPSDKGARGAGAAEHQPATVGEARTRAQVLHETIHGTLQVVHRDFFDPDQRLAIPSRSLEDVFKELARSWQVQIHWLAVSADAMNVDNNARDDFEKQAVRELAAGKPEFEAVAGGVYRFAGSIRLSSQCLKCHVPHRTSTEDRVAGLVISMPLRAAP
jgi:hypothetical protein